MTKLHRLYPVIKVTDKKERSAAIAIAESKRTLDENISRLNNLNVYLNEYMGKFRAVSEQGVICAPNAGISNFS